MSNLIGMELSTDACAMIETAVSLMLSRNEETHELLLRNGMSPDNEVMQDDLRTIGTLRNLLAVLDASVSVYVVMRKE